MAQKHEPQERTARAVRTKKVKGNEAPATSSLAQQSQPVQAKPTLEQFISQNDKLLGAMAVFTGLAAFTKDLQFVGGYMSFTFIAATLLVWFELLGKFPKQSGTGTLFWFENLMSIGILGLAAFLAVGVLLFARDQNLVAAPLTAAFLIPTLWAAVKVTDWFWRKRAARSEPATADRYFTYIVVVLSAGLVANLAANFAAGPVTSTLNAFQPPRTSPSPSHSPSPSPSPMSTPSPTPSPTPLPSLSASPTPT